MGGYQAHWQLLPPRAPLPPSLAPASSLLLHPDLLRLVWFILRSCAPASTCTPAHTPAAPGGIVAVAGAQLEEQQLQPAAVRSALGPGNQGSDQGLDQGFDQGSGAGFPEVAFSEDVLLSALNLLSLQLHQLLAASSQVPDDRLQPGVTAHAVAALTGRQAGRYSYQPLGISAALASLLAPPVLVSEEVADCCRCAQGRHFSWAPGWGLEGPAGCCVRETAALCTVQRGGSGPTDSLQTVRSCHDETTIAFALVPAEPAFARRLAHILATQGRTALQRPPPSSTLTLPSCSQRQY